MSLVSSPVTSIAPLRNVAVFAELVQRVQNRRSGLPGLAAFYGPAGRGKSFAAAYSANKFRAYYVQLDSTWTQRFFCHAILREMGIVAARSTPEMIEQIGLQLTTSRRPLIIDEADFLVARRMIEIVRAIYERSGAGIVLIGEQGLPQALERWERVHSRLLDAKEAQPPSLADVKLLARIYAAGVEIAEDLLNEAAKISDGSVRRLAVNLDRIAEQAQTAGVARMDLSGYRGPWFTGKFDGGGK